MTTATFLALFATYKYFILFPIAVLEGHLVSLIVGFLGRLGYLNPIIAGAVIMSGNLTGDVILYWLGYHKGEAFLGKYGSYVGITHERILKSKALFQQYHGRILFLAKLTNGFGLITAILFTAGLARVPFRTYLLWNILGEAIWTFTLVSLGYFFGNIYTQVGDAISKVGLIAALAVGLVLILQGYRYGISRYLSSTTHQG